MSPRQGDNRFYFFGVFFIVSLLGYFAYQVIKPFLVDLAWSAVLTMLFYPVYSFINRFVKRDFLSSIITICIILVIILGPVSYLSYLIVQEMQGLMKVVKAEGFDPVKSLMSYPLINGLVEKGLSLFSISEAEFQKMVVENVSKFGKEFMGGFTRGLGNVASFGFDFVLVIFAMFFLLEDGPKFLSRLQNFLPFSKEQKNTLIKQVRDIVISTMYGGIAVAIGQALIGGFAFLFLGVPSPVLWGMAMFITSFIPVVGTFIVWGPATVYLLLKGYLLKALILVIVGVLGISMVDNILRPLIVGGRTQMPTLIILLSILGGIKFFGFIGFILGPLVIALFFSVLEIIRISEERRSNPGA